MANLQKKKIIQKNEQLLTQLQKIFLGVNAYFIIIRLLFQYSSLTFYNLLAYIFTVGLSWLIYFQLIKLAKPTLNGAQIVNPGEDLSSKGLISYMFDILYITWFIQVTTTISNYFWYVYLLIPGYGAYLLIFNIVLPIFKFRNGP
ncbi:DUF788-domain-containing protein [Neoconidiobolus thromboides FSU 785]|nr:DUF788-domain-containing protein [Neoconidiobolus thromboides FSU 785]